MNSLLYRRVGQWFFIRIAVLLTVELYELVSLYHALQSIICSKDGNDFPLFIGFNLNYLLAIFIYYFNIHVYGHSTQKFKSSCSG